MQVFNVENRELKEGGAWFGSQSLELVNANRGTKDPEIRCWHTGSTQHEKLGLSAPYVVACESQHYFLRLCICVPASRVRIPERAHPVSK
jgi:hypothetical protein